MKKILITLLAAVIILTVFAACQKEKEQAASETSKVSTPASGDSQDKNQGYVIGFTDNYNGNTLHQQQERYFEELAEEMKGQGIISEYYIAVANKDVATQVSQIQNFVMMGCDAIIVDPTSSSGIDGAIQEAVEAGVEVMIFNDGPVSSPDCYQLNVDCIANFGYLTEWCAEKLNYEGNVLVVRGIAGTAYDDLAYEGIKGVVDKYPKMNIVGEVYGEWTSTVALAEIAAILPSLDKVDLVCGESGDAYGAAMAFEAAGLDVPLIYGGNRGEFLNWWMEEYKTNGYETISGVATPWFSAAALYLTIDLLDGVDIPKYMYYPMDLITQENLFDFEGIPDSEVATSTYDLVWVRENLETQDEIANKPGIVN